MAEAANALLPPRFVDKAPAGMVLTKMPPVGDCTLTLNVQEPFAGICAPLFKVTEPAPGVAVTIPLAQVVAALGVGAMTKPEPAGNVSVIGDVNVALTALALLR